MIGRPMKLGGNSQGLISCRLQRAIACRVQMNLLNHYSKYAVAKIRANLGVIVICSQLALGYIRNTLELPNTLKALR